MFSMYRSLTDRIWFKESTLYTKSVVSFCISDEEYPWMYSLSGVKVINKIVRLIKRTEKIPPKTKAFKRLSLNENRSSKVSSFNTTKRYLNVSFSLIFSFLLFSIVQISTQIYNVFKFSDKLLSAF